MCSRCCPWSTGCGSASPSPTSASSPTRHDERSDARADLEASKIDYILARRERSDAEGYEIVLADTKPMGPLSIPLVGGYTTDIKDKEVLVHLWGGKGQVPPLCRPLQS